MVYLENYFIFQQKIKNDDRETGITPLKVCDVLYCVVPYRTVVVTS